MVITILHTSIMLFLTSYGPLAHASEESHILFDSTHSALTPFIKNIDDTLNILTAATKLVFTVPLTPPLQRDETILETQHLSNLIITPDQTQLTPTIEIAIVSIKNLCKQRRIIHQETCTTKLSQSNITPNADAIISLAPYPLSSAQINEKNTQQQTPLHQAIQKRHPALVAHLLDLHADPTITDKEGNTALHLAVNAGSLAIFTQLLPFSDLINTPNVRKETPLHRAIYVPNQSIIRLLLEQKANPDVYDEYLFTPYDLCTTRIPFYRAAKDFYRTYQLEMALKLLPKPNNNKIS